MHAKTRELEDLKKVLGKKDKAMKGLSDTIQDLNRKILDLNIATSNNKED